MRLLWPSMFIRFLFQKNNDNAYNFCKQRSHISTLVIFSFISLSAGLLEFKYALDLTRYLKNEMNYIPWDAGYSSISSLTHILPKSGDIYKDLRVSFQHNFLVISKQVLLLFSNWLRTMFQYRKRSFTKITNISCIEISIRIDKTKFQKTWFSWQWHPLRQVIKIRLFNLDLTPDFLLEEMHAIITLFLFSDIFVLMQSTPRVGLAIKSVLQKPRNYLATG